MGTTTPRQGRPAARAFTLIEVLVIVAIVAVLTGMLLPAVSLVKSSARTLHCGNSLRQLHLASTVAAEEEEGRFYLRRNTISWFMLSPLREALQLPAGSRFPRPLICPAASRALASGDASGLFPPPSSWGYVDSYLPWADDLYYLGAQVRSPASRLWMVDGLDWIVFWDQAPSYAGEGGASLHMPAYRHARRINAAFWDGHVAGLTLEQSHGDYSLWTPCSP